MAGSTLQEWLDRNAHRRFPFVEDSDLSCENGAELPNELLLDARFCLFGLEDGPALVRSATIRDDGSASMVVDLPGLQGVEIPASGVWSRPPDYSARVVFGFRGRLVPLAGEYRLVTPAPILRSRILSVPYGIGADTLTCGGVTAHGAIRVADGHNTTLDIGGNNLVLALGKGRGLGVVCRDDPKAELCDGKVLYFLNGQKADSDGNIDILAGEGVSVTTGTYKGIPAVIVKTSAVVNGFAYG